MKLADIIILSLCVGFLVIGIYETMVWGISYSYLWFMICIGLLLYFNFRRRQERAGEEKEKPGKRNR